MASNVAFGPSPAVLAQGGTLAQGVAITVTGTATNSAIDTSQRYQNFRFVNVGTNTIYLAAAAPSSQNPNYATPVATTSSTWVMLGNTVEVFTLPPNCVVSVIASTTGNTLYIIPGEGL